MAGDHPQIMQANALMAAGRADLAAQMLRPAAAAEPTNADLHATLAKALLGCEGPEAAAPAALAALEARPESYELRYEYAVMLMRLVRYDEAIPHLEALVTQNPGDPRAWVPLVASCLSNKRPVDAERHARAARRLHPLVPEIELNYASALLRLGEATESVAVLRGLVARFPGFAKARNTQAAGMNYVPGVTPEEVMRAHSLVSSQFGLAAPRRRPANPDPDRSLRVGILSPDFRDHSVASFVEPLFAHLEASSIAVVAFNSHPLNDAVGDRLRAYGREWVDVARLENKALDAEIRARCIDVLVELSGLTRGQRLAALVNRPAPVQMTYLGYPNTTGCRFIDYRIVDSLTDPEGAERYCAEKLLRLDPCFLCFRAPEAAPEVRARPERDVVFGCFGALQKYSEELLRLWGMVLAAVPGSRLLLKSRGLEDASVQERVLGRLAAAGVERGRVRIAGNIAAASEHLALYGEVDVALDTYPYHGTTTTCEAVWMGVPTVSLVGQTHASRVGLSLLTNLGMAELATRTPEEFVRVAAELGRDPARLAAFRASLRERMRSSPLMDAEGFAGRFGAMVREVGSPGTELEFAL